MVFGGVASHEVSNSTEEVGFRQKLRVQEEILALPGSNHEDISTPTPTTSRQRP